MSKNKNKKTANNLSIIILVVILLLLSFGGGFFLAQRYTGGEEIKTDNVGASDEKKKDDNQQSIQEPEEKELASDIESKTPEKYDGEDPNLNADLSGFVTYAGVNNGNLMIRVSIDQFLASGECRLKIGDRGYDANIVPSASNSTCDGFDVSLTDINASGDLEFEIELSSGEKAGVIAGNVSL